MMTRRYEFLRRAVEAHAGQKDKCGRDAVLHGIAVSRAIEDGVAPFERQESLDLAIDLALIHDVPEDTSYALSGLSEFEERLLVALTHEATEPYFSYIERLCRYPVARVVKLADLWHNLQVERQRCLPEKEQRSLESRYLKARDMIWEAHDFPWWPEDLGVDDPLKEPLPRQAGQSQSG